MWKKYFTRTTLALLVALLTILTLFSLSSCKKEITPGNYTLGEETLDTTTWQWQYANGGTLPNWGNGSNNELYDTKWVVLRYNIGGFSMAYPNDTIRFVDNSHYTLNNGLVADYLTYQISPITGSTNKTLTLNFFSTFGGSNYSGQVGQYFVSQALSSEIPITFINMQFNTTTNAWFIRIL